MIASLVIACGCYRPSAYISVLTQGCCALRTFVFFVAPFRFVTGALQLSAGVYAALHLYFVVLDFLFVAAGV